MLINVFLHELKHKIIKKVNMVTNLNQGGRAVESLETVLEKMPLLEKNLLNDLLNNVYDIMVLLDTNWRILWANEKLNQIGDIDLDSIQGKYCYKAWFDKEKPCVGCHLKQVVETGETKGTEYKFIGQRVYAVKSFLLKDTHDSVVAVILFGLDITEQVILNNENNYKKVRDIFFTNLSHELRTPVNLISTTLQLLNKKHQSMELSDKVDQMHRKYIGIIEKNNNRMIKIINNLLDITSVRFGTFQLEPIEDDIVGFLEGIVESVKEYIKDKRIIKFETQLEWIKVVYDPYVIKRIILNLFSNSIKFTGPGDEILVRFEVEQNNYQIVVKDNGLGITEEKLAEIFQPLNKGDLSLNRKTEGSGMGLTIVQLFVRLLEGELDIKSSPGAGTELILKFPFKSDLLEKGNNKVKINPMDNVDIELSDIYL